MVSRIFSCINGYIKYILIIKNIEGSVMSNKEFVLRALGVSVLILVLTTIVVTRFF